MMTAVWHVTITRDDITLALAILGSTLGVSNFLVDHWRNRVRLRIVPKLYGFTSGARNISGTFTWDRPLDDGRDSVPPKAALCVEVQNIGNKAVTIGNVGFARRGAGVRHCILAPLVNPPGPWPRRLEPHSAFTAYGSFTPEEFWKENKGGVDYAFAETESDKIFTGTSRILEYIKKRYRDNRHGLKKK